MRLYGDAADNAVSKWFSNADFGYTTITVERPLRLNYSTAEVRVTRLLSDKTLAKLPQSEQQALQQCLQAMGDVVWRTRTDAERAIKAAVRKHNITLTAAQLKAVLAVLSERDAAAAPVTDSKCQPEPDAELRDTENVPLSENISQYFQREVLPHVPDAWIDEEKSRVGYEIPFTRHFYQYQQPRSLAEIDAELLTAVSDIQRMLAELAR